MKQSVANHGKEQEKQSHQDFIDFFIPETAVIFKIVQYRSRLFSTCPL
jgi:hypothetical protein